jgi:hypothetical protein
MDNIPLGVRTVDIHQHNFLNRHISITSCLAAPELAPTQYSIILPSHPHTVLNFQSGDPHKEVNGITMEALLAVCIDRLQHFQNGQFRSRENAIALTHLEDAMHWLLHRTKLREARGVEGQQVP